MEFIENLCSVCRVLLIQLVTHPLKHTHIRTHPHSCLYRKWSDLIGTNFFSCNLIGGNKKLPHVCLMLLSLRVSGDWNERRRPLHLSLHTTNTSLAQTPVCFFYSTVFMLFTPAPSPRSWQRFGNLQTRTIFKILSVIVRPLSQISTKLSENRKC